MGKSLQVPSGVRALVLARDGHHCARCGRSVLNYPSSLHHRLPRRMGGTRDPRINDPRNLIRLCGTGTSGCHEFVESHRDLSRATGWLLPSLDELASPLITVYGTRIVLTADGGREDVWPADDLTPSEVTSR
jgi:hypothetical protein